MKIKVVVLTVISLLAMHLSTMPAHAADHANAYGFTNWNPNRISLSESQSIEQEFTVLAASGIKEGQTFRWTNQYHLHFCWKSQISDSANKPCGLFGFSLGGMSGGSYTGNLEFNLFTSTEFKITDSSVYCRNFSDSVKIQGVQTFNYTCWRGVTIKPGVKYILRLESFSVLGSNYWTIS